METKTKAKRSTKREPPPHRVAICLDQCPDHGLQAISVASLGTGCGHRLTNSKCCGKWRTVRQWTVNIDDLIKELQDFRGVDLACMEHVIKE